MISTESISQKRTEVSSIVREDASDSNFAGSMEVNFLLALLKNDWPASKHHMTNTVAVGELDWRMVLRLAMHHGVIDLVYQNAVDHPDLMIPDSLMESLRANNHVSAQKNLFLASQLILIKDLFEHAGLNFLSLKGPLLGSYLYDNISLRPFGDLDIVVKRDQIFRAKELLLESGFLPTHVMSAAEEEDYVDQQYALTLTKKKGDFYIVAELHWALTHKFFSFRFTPEELWTRTQSLDLLGVQMNTLKNGLLMLFLCVHGAKHDWNRLIWLCDIARLSTRFSADDWDDLFDLARRTGSVRMVTVGLELSRVLLGAELPEIARDRISRDGKTSYWVGELLTETKKGVPGKTPKLFSMRFQTGVRERLSDRWGSYFQQLKLVLTPTHKDREIVDLPRILSPVYYLIRPVRILLQRRKR